MMVTYYWLNQRPEENSSYEDSVGEAYHFTDKNRGGKSIEEGDRFLYYLPGDHLIFGHGVFGGVENVETGNPTTREHYVAHIKEYESIDDPINVRDIKDEISFLKDRIGLRGIPQESIRSISKKDFEKLVKD